MARSPKAVFCTINGIPVLEGEEITIALCMQALTAEQMEKFLGETTDQVKKRKTPLLLRFNVANAAQLARKCEMGGFDIYGNYNKKSVFTPRELKRLQSLFPALELKPPIPLAR